MSTEAAQLPPLIVQAVERLGCSSPWNPARLLPKALTLSRSLLQILDVSHGREVYLIDLILHSARHSGIEDVVVCTEGTSCSYRARIEQLLLAKKRLFNRLRVVYVPLPKTAKCELDALKQVEATLGGSVLSRGFFWTEAWIIPPENWTTLYSAHKRAAKKDSSIMMTLLPYSKASETSIDAGASHKQLLVTDSKTNELWALHQYNGYEIDTIDFKKAIPMQGRWSNPPEGIAATTDMSLTSSFFAAPSLTKEVIDNFDFCFFADIVDNALSREIKMEGIYIHKEESLNRKYVGLPLTSPRVLYEYILYDATTDSDRIQDKGVRSYFRRDKAQSTCLYHESSTLDKGSEFDYFLCLNNCRIGRGKFKNCLFGSNVIVPDKADFEDLIIADDVDLRDVQAALTVRGPAVIVNKCTFEPEQPSELSLYEFENLGKNLLIRFKPSESAACDMAKLDLYPNAKYKERCRSLKNDPSKDPEVILDALYEGTGKEADGPGQARESDDNESNASEEDFEEEVQSMVLSVLNNPQHLQNMELELRSYRLAAFKSDRDALKSILPVLLSAIIHKHDPNCSATVLQRYVDRSGVGELISKFVISQETIYDVYQSISDFVEAEKHIDPSAGNEDPSVLILNNSPGAEGQYVRLWAALDDILDNGDNLSQWISSHKPDLLNCPQIKRYLEWMEGAEDEEDSS